MVVTASPLQSSPAQLGRTVHILTADDLRSAGTVSIPEALKRLTTVAISERGDPGIQADIGIRGATYDQVLLSVEGLPMTDAQTGHHNADLPLPMGAVGRIEVIPGPGLSLLGPGALGGAANITARVPEEYGVRASASAGSFDTWRAGSAVDLVSGNIAAVFAADWARSDGFQEGTDYDVWSGWASWFIEDVREGVRISMGYADKDFGAQDFYGDYPARELTSALLLDLAPYIEFANGWGVRAAGRFRHHDDRFILVRSNPAYYQNRHRTDTFTERITVTTPESGFGRTAAGFERSDASLDSSRLGDRRRFANSVFAQHRLGRDKDWSLDLGVRADAYGRWGTETSPSLSAFRRIADGITLRAAGGRAVRPPTFTELYYRDPRNEGNADLDPEAAWGGEMGADFDLPRAMRLSATAFLRRSDDLIDWVRPTPDQPWRAANVGEATTQGAEFGLGGKSAFLDWQVRYLYMDLDANTGGMESKYALNVARNDVGVTLALPATQGFTVSVDARYREVPSLDNYTLLGARVSQAVGLVTLFAQGRNLLNENYSEIPGVPTAGRSWEAGVEFAW